MNNGRIEDTQKKAFRELITTGIPKILESLSCDLNDEYAIKFTPLEANNKLVLKDERGTEYYSIKVKCVLSNKYTNETVEFNVEVLKVPVLQELGFKIKGNYMQYLDVYERARGWSFIDDGKTDYAKLLADNNRSFSFNYNKSNGKTNVSFAIRGPRKTTVSPSTFLRTMTGYSNDEIISMFGYQNKFMIEMFGMQGDNRDIHSCIRSVADAMFGDLESNPRTTSVLRREVMNNVMSHKYFPLGASNVERLQHSQSFSYRANGKVLAENINCNGYVFNAGLVLTEKELKIIDMLPLKSIKVEYQGKIFQLHKFSSFTFDVLGCKLAEDVTELGLKKNKILDEVDVDSLNHSSLKEIIVDSKVLVSRRLLATSLTRDDLFTAFSIWADNLNGFDLHEKQYEVSNRILITFDKKIENLIQNHITKVISNVSSKLNLIDLNGKLSLAIEDCNTGIDVDAFINEITNTKSSSGQMSDMCNIISYLSKSNKTTAQVSTSAVTDDMRCVQDLQEGRLDPLDVPESDAIGKVHNRSLLTSLDSDGNAVSPYLRIVNGEVVSEEPVYLTAMQEADQYIAEWNETFHNPDGSLKKRIRTRCNGDVQSVEIERVTYKQVSPYQDMSIAHAMAPFPGHSNGKRITMECNQVKQALPTVNTQFPVVCSGGESILDVGTYTAKGILDDFYETNRHLLTESKEETLKRSIKLKEITSDRGIRTLHFEVLGLNEPNTAVLTIPYLFRSYECGMFSYNVNPKKDNVYTSDDVVAYYNGYRIDKQEVVACADFGSQKVDMDIFGKGISLVQNLHVGYKTYEGSVIEDGILISDKLVYDDTLTHIGLTEVKETIAVGTDADEQFAIQIANAPDYMQTNGLPVVGTYLKPGMKAIGKIRKKVGTNKGSVAKFVYVPMHVEGEVISAKISKTPNGLEASIWLARRAYVKSGDKMAGRCGNKGVVARIVPASEMPYSKESGQVLDIVLNPLGIPSRQNITQLLEATLGLCMSMEHKVALVTPYNENDVDFVREQAENHNVHPEVMIDGRTGLEFTRRINHGVLPMYKLHHIADRKIHAVGMDAKLHSVFLQPMKGSKSNGGQNIGEMEAWCFESVEATKVLQELFSTQSDDVDSRLELIAAQHAGLDVKINGNNHNDLAMQACYRSLGVEIITDADNQSYRFEPLTDDIIKSLSARPITNESMLHSTKIFGETGSIADRTDGMKNWGWIDLHTKIVFPLWITKGHLHTMIGLSSEQISNVVFCNGYVRFDRVNNFVAYYSEEEFKELVENGEFDVSALSTGMSAIVDILQNYDMKQRETTLQLAINERKQKIKNYINDNKYKTLIDIHKIVHDFNKSGVQLSDYVVSSFPVMPQTFRPLIKINGRNSIPSFDWYYMQIINAASAVEKSPTDAVILDLYKAILAFTGVSSLKEMKSQKYTNLLGFFSGKEKNSHGGLREHVQSKRVMCSGRAAIKPAEDITRSPLEIGIPFTMLVKMYEEPLYGYFIKMSSAKDKLNKSRVTKLLSALARRDHREFTRIYNKYKFSALLDLNDTTTDPYTTLTEIVKAFLEGRNGNVQRCVLVGRQPSLHKYSIRAFKPYVVYDKLIHIHPLVCKGFNADFDGDQMHATATQTQEATEEAFAKMSPAQDLLLPKSGAVVLEHSQDIVLGIYCATMFRNNSLVCEESLASASFYNNIEQLRLDYMAGVRSLWDIVVFDNQDDKYISTAGRILFNSLIPDGFTQNKFTNQLHVADIKPELYKELKYDGIVCGGSAGQTGDIKYYSLPDICKETYELIKSDAVDVYQKISEFGFIASDKTGVSLSLEDFDIETNKDEILKDAEHVKEMIEQDYQDGLISREDKREALISVYGDSQNGANAKIMQSLLDNLSRNNNIFIMMDSGARGNKTQLMHMCGAIGILQKTKTEDLETSVTKNYYSGLNSFDVHLASYSARTGVASTQNETKLAGYTTHQAVYMASGIQVVESDCGKDDWSFDIQWSDHKDNYDMFLPSIDWFNKNLVGKKIDPSDELARSIADENGIVQQSKYQDLIVAQGFSKLKLESGMLKADIYDARGHKVLDDKSKKLLKHISPEYVLTPEAIDVLLRAKSTSVTTDIGTFNLRYSMSSSCRSLMSKRIARGLPYLESVYDEKTGKTVQIVSNKTIDFIEKNKLDTINMRTTLNCKSKYGVCAHCFGLKFSNGQLPEVGSFVGVESAQSIAEPASQLTMNVINKGGVAGASNVSSGINVFKSLLAGGSGATLKSICSAVVAPNSGYISIDKLDNGSVVSIVPEKTSLLCARCMSQNGGNCAKDTRHGTSLCRLPIKVPTGDIIQRNGEWINAGDSITKDMIHPDDIISLGEGSTEEQIHTRKQRVWIDNYYNTFKNSGVTVNARHFELIAYVQNKYVKIMDSNTEDFQLGDVVEFNDVKDRLNDVIIKQMVSSKEDVIIRSSGALAALSFENVAGVAADLVTRSHVSSINHNHSLLDSVAVGENLISKELKVLNTPKFKNITYNSETKKQQETPIFIRREQTTSSAINLDDFDLVSLTSDILTGADDVMKPVDSFTEAVTKESVPAEKFVSTEKLDKIDPFTVNKENKMKSPSTMESDIPDEVTETAEKFTASEKLDRLDPFASSQAINVGTYTLNSEDDSVSVIPSTSNLANDRVVIDPSQYLVDEDDEDAECVIDENEDFIEEDEGFLEDLSSNEEDSKQESNSEDSYNKSNESLEKISSF